MASADPELPSVRPLVVVLAAHYVRRGAALQHGGAEKYVRNCVEALLGAGAGVLINYSGDSIYDELLGRCGRAALNAVRTDWMNADLGGDRRLDGRVIRRRWRWFRRVRPDAVLVVQQGHGTAFGASVAAARLSGARVVMSVRQPPMAPPPIAPRRYAGVVPAPGLWRRRLHWRSAVVGRCCHAILFNSERVRGAHLAGSGWPAARSHVVPNGVEQRPLDRRPRDGGPVRFGFVGQLAAHKGADLAWDAFRRLGAAREGRPRLEMVFFGDGPLKEPLRSQADGLPVRFTGYETDRERMYEQMDVLVMPSRREASSNAVLEAMARGVPCIVSNVGGLPELVAEGAAGVIVPADDAAALAAAMAWLAGEPARLAALSEAAWRRARDAHDPAVVMPHMVDWVLGRGGPSRRL